MLFAWCYVDSSKHLRFKFNFFILGFNHVFVTRWVIVSIFSRFKNLVHCTLQKIWRGGCRWCSKQILGTIGRRNAPPGNTGYVSLQVRLQWKMNYITLALDSKLLRAICILKKHKARDRIRQFYQIKLGCNNTTLCFNIACVSQIHAEPGLEWDFARKYYYFFSRLGLIALIEHAPRCRRSMEWVRVQLYDYWRVQLCYWDFRVSGNGAVWSGDDGARRSY